MKLTKAVALYVSMLAPTVSLSRLALAQSTEPAIFVANNGNCEGSVTSFTLNADGTVNFVQKLVVEAAPCGQFVPGKNCQAISISPNGRWLITGHGTEAGITEQLTFFEVHSDATMSIKYITTTPDSPVNVHWIDDEYLAVTATPTGNDFVIVYKFNPDAPSLTQHYYLPVASIFDFVVDQQHDLLISRDGTSGATVFKINSDRTLTEMNADPYATGVFFLGPGLSPDGTKLYYGGGISTFNGLSSRWIGGFNVNTKTGALTPMPNSPYLSPPADGTSGPSPKEVDVSSDNQFAFVNHGGTGHIAGFSINQETGELTPIANSYFNVGGQGDSGNMTIMSNLLFVTRKYSSSQYGPAGLISLTINPDGTLTQNGDVNPTQGSLPWDIATWPGQVPVCQADVTGNSIVDVDDLLMVINNWGGSGTGDITGNGVVDVDDLLVVINSWGPCDT